MQSSAKSTNRFLIESFSLNRRTDPDNAVSSMGLCQKVVLSHVAQLSSLSNGHQLFSQLANELIQVAEYALVSRNGEALDEASKTLMNLPISGIQQIGSYYQAISIERRGQIDTATKLLEWVADKAPIGYRARAIQSLGCAYRVHGYYEEAIKFYREALQAAPDNLHGYQAKLMAQIEIAIVKSIFGDHQWALQHLENLAPIVSLVARQNPFFYYVYHNALAVELGELGRTEEGQAVLAVALNSPYVDTHPEWIETRDELAAKRPSASASQVALPRSPQVEAKPSRKQRQQHNLQTSIHIRLSISKENLILLVTRTATGQIHYRCSTLDRLGETIRPRAPPIGFQV